MVNITKESKLTIFSKGVSVCFSSTCSWDALFYLRPGKGCALAFAEALAQAGIEYSVEWVCLPMPERLRAGRWGLAALERNTIYRLTLNDSCELPILKNFLLVSANWNIPFNFSSFFSWQKKDQKSQDKKMLPNAHATHPRFFVWPSRWSIY